MNFLRVCIKEHDSVKEDFFLFYYALTTFSSFDEALFFAKKKKKNLFSQSNDKYHLDQSSSPFRTLTYQGMMILRSNHLPL